MAALGFMRVNGRRSARWLWQRNARHQCADGSPYLRADCSPTSTITAPGTSAETQPATAAPTTVSPPEPTSPPTQTPVEVGHQPGQKAPDFALTTVDGEQVTLVSLLQGQPVVLYFYATW